MKEKRNIKAQIIVERNDNILNYALIDGLAQFLNAKGWKVSVPHVYPEDPLIIEITEEIPPPNY